MYIANACIVDGQLSGWVFFSWNHLFTKMHANSKNLLKLREIEVSNLSLPMGNFKDTGVNLSVPLEWIDPEPLKPEWLLLVRSEAEGESARKKN